jgi:hypothetical protein
MDSTSGVGTRPSKMASPEQREEAAHASEEAVQPPEAPPLPAVEGGEVVIPEGDGVRRERRRGEGNGPPQGFDPSQMTPEQRQEMIKTMEERMKEMPPDQQERMRERMRRFSGEPQPGSGG